MKKGIKLAIIASIISGISIFYNKLVIIKGIDPLVFNIYKNGGTAIILSILFITLSRKHKLSGLKIDQWKKLFLIGLIGGSIPFLLFFTGLQTVSATNANLIQKTLFLWVAAIAIPVLGERLNIWQVAGYIIIVFSNLFIGGLAGFTGSPGELLILAATILWSIENIIAKITLSDLDSNVVVWGRMGIGVIILLVIAIFQNKLNLIFQPHSDQFFPLLGSILLLTGYVTFWYKALKHAPATVVTSVLVLATPITNVLTAIFIYHNFPQIQIYNLFLTVLGVSLISYFFSKSGRIVNTF